MWFCLTDTDKQPNEQEMLDEARRIANLIFARVAVSGDSTRTYGPRQDGSGKP
jgi:hypothetical protein